MYRILHYIKESLVIITIISLLDYIYFYITLFFFFIVRFVLKFYTKKVNLIFNRRVIMKIFYRYNWIYSKNVYNLLYVNNYITV